MMLVTSRLSEHPTKLPETNCGVADIPLVLCVLETVPPTSFSTVRFPRLLASDSRLQSRLTTYTLLRHCVALYITSAEACEPESLAAMQKGWQPQTVLSESHFDLGMTHTVAST